MISSTSRFMAALALFFVSSLMQADADARPKRDTNQNQRVLAKSEQSPPPTFFIELGKNLNSVDYHVNSKMPLGWTANTICTERWPGKRHMTQKTWSKIRTKKRDCAALLRSYKTAIIRDKKYRGDTVAQDLHLWIYKSPSAARRAEANMDDMTLKKRPYWTWRRGKAVLVLEGRWRFKRFAKELKRYVNEQLKDQGWKTK